MVLKVTVGTLGIGYFIGTCKGSVVVVGLAVDIAEMCIHRGQSAVDSFFSLEKSGFIYTARLFFQNIRARSKKQHHQGCSYYSFCLYTFH